MTAPSATTRVSPAGKKLKRGFSSLITLAGDTNIDFWEREVTPPSLDGGEPIPQTTMHNTIYKTFAPQELITVGPTITTVMYDPKVYDQIVARINKEDTITVKFGDGSTIAFYGCLQKFEPAGMTENGEPLATVTFFATNVDPTAETEAGPVLAEVSGT